MTDSITEEEENLLEVRAMEGVQMLAMDMAKNKAKLQAEHPKMIDTDLSKIEKRIIGVDLGKPGADQAVVGTYDRKIGSFRGYNIRGTVTGRINCDGPNDANTPGYKT